MRSAALGVRAMNHTSAVRRSPRGRSVRVPGLTRWEASSLCEAIRCLHDELIGDVGSAVVFVFDYMQGGKRELLCEAPDHTERRRNVEPATNEHRRNIGDAVDAPADAIRRQKRVLAEEVSHQASEAEAKRSVGVAGARLRRSVQGCMDAGDPAQKLRITPAT